MFDNEDDISIVTGPTPFWKAHIMDFDGLEIMPCEIIGYDLLGGVIAEPCEPEHAAFWAVYGHYRPTETRGGLEDFADFATEAAAHRFHDALLQEYPHLRGDRPQSQQDPSPLHLVLV